MFELFEIFNEYNKRIIFTKEVSCLPEKEHLNSMLSNRHKVKIDGKVATKKSINELYSNYQERIVNEDKSKKINKHSKNARKRQ